MIISDNKKNIDKKIYIRKINENQKGKAGQENVYK